MRSYGAHARCVKPSARKRENDGNMIASRPVKGMQVAQLPNDCRLELRCAQIMRAHKIAPGNILKIPIASSLLLIELKSTKKQLDLSQKSKLDDLFGRMMKHRNMQLQTCY